MPKCGQKLLRQWETLHKHCSGPALPTKWMFEMPGHGSGWSWQLVHFLADQNRSYLEMLMSCLGTGSQCFLWFTVKFTPFLRKIFCQGPSRLTFL